MKASYLFEQGKMWSAHVWIKGDYDNRNEIIATMNTALEGTEIKVGRGWQEYDPVVRLGRARNYVSIAADLDEDPVNNADRFIAFADEECELNDLPRALQELCVIVYFAEVGRGYSSTLENELFPLVEDIQSGIDTWSSIKTRYTPSLTYKEDEKDYILE